MHWYRERKIYFLCARCGYKGYVSPPFALIDRAKTMPCPKCQTVSTIRTRFFSALVLALVAFAGMWGVSILASAVLGISPSMGFGIAVAVFLVALFSVRSVASRVLYSWEVTSRG